jgi:alpha-beta hydrolase superfamily lysophospholipase
VVEARARECGAAHDAFGRVPQRARPAHLSRDPEVVRAYREDPLVHDRISPRTYFAFMEAAQRCRQHIRTLQVPTLMFQGMADQMVDPKGALEAAGAAPARHAAVRDLA